MIVQSIDQLVGNTPLMHLDCLSDHSKNINVYGKLEMFNPGCSVKDRTAQQLLAQARQDGKLKPGYTIVESSSGNMGHALAMLCAHYDYKFICILDPKTPQENIALVRTFGGEVRIVSEPDKNGSFQQKRIEVARSLAQRIPNCINLDQYNNPAAVDAHSITTGPEIYNQLDGKIDVLIGSVSTGSHLSGIARYIKSRSPKTTIMGVEPYGSVVFGGQFKPFLQNGIGLSFTPDNYCPEFVDLKWKVSDQDAFTYCHKLAREAGLLLGGSSGSIAYAAHEYAKTCTKPTNIVILCADTGLKYLQTIYNDEWLKGNNIEIKFEPIRKTA